MSAASHASACSGVSTILPPIFRAPSSTVRPGGEFRVDDLRLVQAAQRTVEIGALGVGGTGFGAVEIGQQAQQLRIVGRGGVAGTQAGERGEFVLGGIGGAVAEQSGHRADQGAKDGGLVLSISDRSLRPLSEFFLLHLLDSSPARLAMAKRFGADVVINFQEQDPVAEIRRLTGGRGVDVAIEALGRQETFENALRAMRVGGTLSSLGVYSGKLVAP